MQPFSLFQQQLFPALPPTQTRFFACGHVVPAENVLAISLARGPTGNEEFNFGFNFRGKKFAIVGS